MSVSFYSLYIYCLSALDWNVHDYETRQMCDANCSMRQTGQKVRHCGCPWIKDRPGILFLWIAEHQYVQSQIEQQWNKSVTEGGYWGCFFDFCVESSICGIAIFMDVIQIVIVGSSLSKFWGILASTPSPIAFRLRYCLVWLYKLFSCDPCYLHGHYLQGHRVSFTRKPIGIRGAKLVPLRCKHISISAVGRGWCKNAITTTDSRSMTLMIIFTVQPMKFRTG